MPEYKDLAPKLLEGARVRVIKGKYTGMLAVTKVASFRQVGDKVYPVVEIIYPPANQRITVPRTFIVLALDDVAVTKKIPYHVQNEWDMKTEARYWDGKGDEEQRSYEQE